MFRDTSTFNSAATELLGNFEQLGDAESVESLGGGKYNCSQFVNHYVSMFAHWTVNTYKVNLNINRDNNDSTYGEFYDNGVIGRTSCQSGVIPITLYVVFDTNLWYYESNGTEKDLTDIIVEKFGYLWIGWYTDAKAMEAQDFFMTGFDYNYVNDYNKYADRVDTVDSYIKYYAAGVDLFDPYATYTSANDYIRHYTIDANLKMVDGPYMRPLDYSMFNQSVFRTYGQVVTNDNLDEFEATLEYADATGFKITESNFYASTNGYGNWVEDRTVEGGRFEITLYAKWQGIIYQVSFNDTSFGNNDGIGSTTAYYITSSAANAKYESTTAKSNDEEVDEGKMYVMFDKKLYTSSYEEIWQVESDYLTVVRGEHINEIINIDRYGYTWTGWYTRGYENRTETLSTGNQSTYYYGSMKFDRDSTYTATDGLDHYHFSTLVIDGHNASDKTYRSGYNLTYVDEVDFTKFDINTYLDLQKNVTKKFDSSNKLNTSLREFTFTLYAGWEANAYKVYYESNAINTVQDYDNYSQYYDSHLSGSYNRDEYSTLAIGTSPAYKLTNYDEVEYATILYFDGNFTDPNNRDGYVECSAWQRFGYTFTG